MSTDRTASTDAPGTDVSVGDYERLVRLAMEQVKAGKTTLPAVLQELAGTSLPTPPAPAAPGRVPELSKDVLAALRELPTLWEAVVVPSAPRKMTAPESAAMARLRLAIDTISGPLGKAKSEIIRGAVAHHLDAVAEAQGVAFREDEQDRDLGVLHEATPRDADGHYLLKQHDPVAGTGLRWERRVSEGSIIVSSARIQAAYAAGKLTREQYLAVTSVPDVPREFDQEKARKAIVKDPSLLVLLAEHAVAVKPSSTSIYLTLDK